MKKLCHCDDWQKQGSFVEGHTTPDTKMMGKPQVLSFWELLDIFAWYIFSWFVLQVVGRYQEQELDWGKLKKARLLLFCKVFWDFLKLKIVEMESIDQEYLEILERVTYVMSIYVCVCVCVFGYLEVKRW